MARKANPENANKGRPEDKAAYKVANGIRGIWRSANQLGIDVPLKDRDIYTMTIKAGQEENFTAEQMARMIEIVVKVINKERAKQTSATPADLDAEEADN